MPTLLSDYEIVRMSPPWSKPIKVSQVVKAVAISFTDNVLQPQTAPWAIAVAYLPKERTIPSKVSLIRTTDVVHRQNALAKKASSRFQEEVVLLFQKAVQPNAALQSLEPVRKSELLTLEMHSMNVTAQIRPLLVAPLNRL